MNLKKLITLVMTTILTTSIFVGCSKKTNNNQGKGNDVYRIAMITDVAGVNDQSFNQSAWEGLEKAQKDLGVEVKYLESKQDADYSTNVEALVDEEVDMIIGVGSKLAPIIEDAS